MSLDVKNLRIITTTEKSISNIIKKMEKDGFEAVSIEEVERKEFVPHTSFSRRNPLGDLTDRWKIWTEKNITFRKIEKMDL